MASEPQVGHLCPSETLGLVVVGWTGRESHSSLQSDSLPSFGISCGHSGKSQLALVWMKGGALTAKHECSFEAATQKESGSSFLHCTLKVLSTNRSNIRISGFEDNAASQRSTEHLPKTRMSRLSGILRKVSLPMERWAPRKNQAEQETRPSSCYWGQSAHSPWKLEFCLHNQTAFSPLEWEKVIFCFCFPQLF